MRKLKQQAIVGLLIWILIQLTQHISLFHTNWHIALIQLASLVWLPLGIDILMRKAYYHFPTYLTSSALPSGILLSYALIVGTDGAKYLVLPYWLLIIVLLGYMINDGIKYRFDIAVLTLTMSVAMLGIAMSAISCYLWQIPIFGFAEEILLLTGAHFHYAGFMVMLMAGLLVLHHRTLLSKTLSISIMLTVPITALGITLNQLYGHYKTETFAAIFVAVTVITMIFQYNIISYKQDRLAPKIISILGLVIMATSMTMAILYALRYYCPLPYINITTLKAIHGTCNGVLFPLMCFGFWYAQSTTSYTPNSN